VSADATRGTARRPFGGALLCALLLAGTVTPRIAVELHHHPGGDRGHVHLAADAAHVHHDSRRIAPAHDHHGSHRIAPAHDHLREAPEPSSRVVHTGPRDHHRGHMTPPEPRPSHDGPRLASARDLDHLHTYDPYERGLRPEPLRAPARLIATPISVAVALDPDRERASSPCARGPPLQVVRI